MVETDVHFPTDYNLLWYSARKCIDIAEKLPVGGWRKSNHWKRSLKGLMRATGKTSVTGGPNKKQRMKTTAGAYLSKARALEGKVDHARQSCNPANAVDLARLVQLDYYHQMLTKHIDLVERRLIKGEKIPHSEKVFSIFLTWTELIKKGSFFVRVSENATPASSLANPWPSPAISTI